MKKPVSIPYRYGIYIRVQKKRGKIIIWVSIPYRYGIYKYGKERNFKKASNVWFQFLIGMVSTVITIVA